MIMKRDAKKDKQEFRRVEVEWLDSCSYSKWHPIDESKNAQPMNCRTVGYLIAKDKSRAVVVGSLCAGEDRTDIDACDRMTIPRGCIKAMHYLDREGTI